MIQTTVNTPQWDTAKIQTQPQTCTLYIYEPPTYAEEVLRQLHRIQPENPALICAAEIPSIEQYSLLDSITPKRQTPPNRYSVKPKATRPSEALRQINDPETIYQHITTNPIRPNAAAILYELYFHGRAQDAKLIGQKLLASPIDISRISEADKAAYYSEKPFNGVRDQYQALSGLFSSLRPHAEIEQFRRFLLDIGSDVHPSWKRFSRPAVTDFAAYHSPEPKDIFDYADQLLRGNVEAYNPRPDSEVQFTRLLGRAGGYLGVGTITAHNIMAELNHVGGYVVPYVKIVGFDPTTRIAMLSLQNNL